MAFQQDDLNATVQLEKERVAFIVDWFDAESITQPEGEWDTDLSGVAETIEEWWHELGAPQLRDLVTTR